MLTCLNQVVWGPSYANGPVYLVRPGFKGLAYKLVSKSPASAPQPFAWLLGFGDAQQSCSKCHS